MTFAPNYALRARQAMERTVAWLLGKPRPFALEIMGGTKDTQLAELVTKVDKMAAEKLSLSLQLEHASAFALVRDSRYLNRNRIWLLRRAACTRFRQEREHWVVYARQKLNDRAVAAATVDLSEPKNLKFEDYS